MIPKIIHYCWFGGKPIPKSLESYIKSWRVQCPDYKIIKWDETNFDIENSCSYVREAAESGKWAFVSDYARLKIVYEHGGIYLDTDVELIKNLDPLLDNIAFFGMEPPFFMVNTGIGFGSEKNYSFLKELMQIYNNLHFINSDATYNTKTCVMIATELFEKKGFKKDPKIQKIEGATIYPNDYFCPINWLDGSLSITNQTYSIHHYEYTWTSPIERKIHLREQKLRKKFGMCLGSKLAYIYRKLYKLFYLLFFKK